MKEPKKPTDPSPIDKGRRDFLSTGMLVGGAGYVGGLGGGFAAAIKENLDDERIKTDLELITSVSDLANHAISIRINRIHALRKSSNPQKEEMIQALLQQNDLSAAIMKDCLQAYYKLRAVEEGNSSMKPEMIVGAAAGAAGMASVIDPAQVCENSLPKMFGRRNMLSEMLKIAGGVSIGAGMGYLSQSEKLMEQNKKLTTALRLMLKKHSELSSKHYTEGRSSDVELQRVEQSILDMEDRYKSGYDNKLKIDQRSVTNGLLVGGGFALAMLSVFCMSKNETTRDAPG